MHEPLKRKHRMLLLGESNILNRSCFGIICVIIPFKELRFLFYSAVKYTQQFHSLMRAVRLSWYDLGLVFVFCCFIVNLKENKTGCALWMGGRHILSLVLISHYQKVCDTVMLDCGAAVCKSVLASFMCLITYQLSLSLVDRHDREDLTRCMMYRWFHQADNRDPRFIFRSKSLL